MHHVNESDQAILLHKAIIKTANSHILTVTQRIQEKTGMPFHTVINLYIVTVRYRVHQKSQESFLFIRANDCRDKNQYM